MRNKAVSLQEACFTWTALMQIFLPQENALEHKSKFRKCSQEIFFVKPRTCIKFVMEYQKTSKYRNACENHEASLVTSIF